MGVPGAAKAVKRAFDWGMRGDGRVAFSGFVHKHAGDVIEEFELDGFDDLRAVLRPEDFVTLVDYVIEDFLVFSRWPEDRSVVDDYLKRRGWKESVPGRAYLTALRDSVVSLYEVERLLPEGRVMVRDLLRGGPAVEVEPDPVAGPLMAGDKCAMRVLEVRGRWYGSSAVLSFIDERMADRVAEDLSKSLADAARGVAQETDAHDPHSSLDAVLAESAERFTRPWIVDVIEFEEKLADWPWDADDPSPEFIELRFPLIGAPDEIGRRLDAADDFQRGEEGRPEWVWSPDPFAHSDAGPDRPSALSPGIMALKADHLMLLVVSEDSAAAGRDLAIRRLGELVGPPTESRQPLYEAFGVEPAPDPDDEPDPEAGSGL